MHRGVLKGYYGKPLVSATQTNKMKHNQHAYTVPSTTAWRTNPSLVVITSLYAAAYNHISQLAPLREYDEQCTSRAHNTHQSARPPQPPNTGTAMHTPHMIQSARTPHSHPPPTGTHHPIQPRTHPPTNPSNHQRTHPVSQPVRHLLINIPLLLYV